MLRWSGKNEGGCLPWLLLPLLERRRVGSSRLLQTCLRQNQGLWSLTFDISMLHRQYSRSWGQSQSRRSPLAPHCGRASSSSLCNRDVAVFFLPDNEEVLPLLELSSITASDICALCRCLFIPLIDSVLVLHLHTFPHTRCVLLPGCLLLLPDLRAAPRSLLSSLSSCLTFCMCAVWGSSLLIEGLLTGPATHCCYNSCSSPVDTSQYCSVSPFPEWLLSALEEN